MAAKAAEDRPGFEIRELSPGAFRQFARRHGTSEEIGPIATVFDKPDEIPDGLEIFTLGLFACGRLCAATTCTCQHDETGRGSGLKLDSIIVDKALRRRGLAGLLVARAFADLLSDPGRHIVTIYSHAVHPATVSLLKRLDFSDPPPVGAPLSSRALDSHARRRLAEQCQRRIRSASDHLRLQCQFCRTRDRRARPWCQSR